MSQSKETTLTLYIPHKHILWSMKHTKKQKTMPKGKIIKALIGGLNIHTYYGG